MLKVLTFSTNISAGHRRAAEAVAQAILSAAPGSQILERDSMTLMGQRRRRVLTETYLGIIKYRPDFWNYLYHNKNLKAGMHGLWRVFLARTREAFEAEIDRFRPDVIVCTQAIPARVIADLKASGRCRVPLIAVATDYGIHPYWADPHIDRYAVPSEEALEELVEDGVSRDRIQVTGIPVHSVFEKPPQRRESREALGIPAEGRFVLVMGGGNGLGITVDDVDALEQVPGVDGLVLVTGCNDKLRAAVEALPSRGKPRFVHATVSGIERYYAACDVLVSKPGGLTMAEATSMGLPIVMVAPLPGQEMRNASFLSRTGVALWPRNHRELSGTLFRLFGDPSRIQRLSEQSSAVGRPDAAHRIATMALAMAHGVQDLRDVLQAVRDSDRPETTIAGSAYPELENAFAASYRA